MNLTKLAYFLSAARALSFTAAAREHYISQTAMSQQIASLERELWVKLFRREGKRVELTGAGRCLEGEAQALLGQYRHLLGELQRYAEGPALRVEYTGPIEKKLLTGMLERFQARYPGVPVELRYETQAGACQDLAAGQCDLAAAVADEFEGENVHKVTLVRNPIQVAVSPKGPLAGRDSLGMEDLAGETVVILTKGSAFRGHDHVKDLLLRLGFRPGQIREADSIEAQLFLVELGQGITFLPAAPELADGQLAFVPFRGVEMWHEIALFYRRETPAIRKFLATRGTAPG